MTQSITDLLGNDASTLLDHRCETISRERMNLPGSDFLERVVSGRPAVDEDPARGTG